MSDSTEKRDRGVKFKDYQAHKVQEYWIIDPESQTLEQYSFEEGEYQLIPNSPTGNVTSVVLKGFEIPILAIFDEAENFEAIRKI